LVKKLPKRLLASEIEILDSQLASDRIIRPAFNCSFLAVKVAKENLPKFEFLLRKAISIIKIKMYLA
jgi:hypothetical protein